MSNFLLYEVPLSIAFVSMFAVLLAAIEVGYRRGLARYRRLGSDNPDVEFCKNDVTLGSMLALLGLMLAFTYAVELNRQDLRKQTTVAEANAIETAFHRVDLATEPGRSQLRAALLDYARTRTSTADQSASKRALDQLRNQSLEAQARLWPLTKALLADPTLPGPIGASIIKAMNAVYDAETKRSTSIYDRMPPIIFALLLLISTLSLGLAAYNAGLQGRINRWRKTLFAFVLSSLMTIIVDFEKPLTGFIEVSQAPITSVIQSLENELQLE